MVTHTFIINVEIDILEIYSSQFTLWRLWSIVGIERRTTGQSTSLS